MLATAQVYNIDSAVVWEHTATVGVVPADGVAELFVIPPLKNVSTTYLLRLQLSIDDETTVISDNVYWLSTQPDVLDWKDSTFYRTACTAYMDLKGLESLPAAQLNVTSAINAADAMVTIVNVGSTVALAVRARLVDSNGVDVAPVFWSDNFVTVWPDEEVQLVATFSATETPILVVESFNRQ
jgi:exo-1,4-beta-D-glucosaminidase